jgi:hypothetical protein
LLQLLILLLLHCFAVIAPVIVAVLVFAINDPVLVIFVVVVFAVIDSVVVCD